MHIIHSAGRELSGCADMHFGARREPRDQCRHFMRRHGLAEQEALGLVAAFGGYPVELFLGFDALRRDPHVQRMAEFDDGPDHRLGLGSRGHLDHEGAVDLDPVEGELLQVAERRIARAEVIEHDLHAELPEIAQAAEIIFAVAEENRLGDLQFEAMGAQTGLGQDLSHAERLQTAA